MKLKLRGLKEGEHKYSLTERIAKYGLDKDQFSNDLQVDVEINVQCKNYYLKLSFSTNINRSCDRCLEDYSIPYSTGTKMIYTEDGTLDPENKQDDLHFLSAGQATADLTDDVRQNLLLNLPMKSICSESCKGLCATCGANLNEKQCDCTDETIDPRWEGLKGLRN